MSKVTIELHQRLLESLQPFVLSASDVERKPIDLDLKPPFHPRLRVYLYTLVEGGTRVRTDEYKAVLRVESHPVGQYRSFSHSSHRITILMAVEMGLDVFVLWNPLLHPKFKNGGNVQVKKQTVYDAVVNGIATQSRKLRGGATETVVACTRSSIQLGMEAHFQHNGGIAE